MATMAPASDNARSANGAAIGSSLLTANQPTRLVAPIRVLAGFCPAGEELAFLYGQTPDQADPTRTSGRP